MIQLITKAANIIMFAVSALLSINLFYKLGDNIISSIVLSVLAVSFEYVKLYSLYQLASPTKGKTGKFWPVALYVLFCSLSLLCSFGFALETIENRNYHSEINNTQVYALIEENNSLSAEITFRETQLQSLPTNYYSTANAITKELRELRTKKLSNSITIKQNESTVNSKADMFQQISNVIGIDRKVIVFVLLLVLSVLLEIGIAYTTLSQEKPVVQSVSSAAISPEKQKALQFVEGLFSSGVSLNKIPGSEKLAEVTHLSVYDCNNLKRFFMGVKKGGKALIEVGQGAAKVTFGKEDFLKAVENLF